MITAIDTSVLLIVTRKEQNWEKWRATLTKAAREGPLVVCCVVFGEFSYGYTNTSVALERLYNLNINYDPILPNTARHAYKNYTRNVFQIRDLPYYLISSHALLQADRIAVESKTDTGHYYSGCSILRKEYGK